MKKSDIEKNWNKLNKATPKRIDEIKSRNIQMKSKKDAKFTARLSTVDFEDLKKAAEDAGIGYQTLLGSIIHKYLSGRLVDIEEVKKIYKISS